MAETPFGLAEIPVGRIIAQIRFRERSARESMAESAAGKTKVKQALADTQVGLAEIPLSRLDRVKLEEFRFVLRCYA